MLNFKNYLNEIKEKDIENVDLNRDLIFDNIFGNKLRILIPLHAGNKELNELIVYLKQDEQLKVDLNDLINKKIVYKKVATKQGLKLRPEKVGGYLQKRIEKAGWPEIKELFTRLLDWWQKNSDKLKNNESGASIIISRSPIDILRMSDHDNMGSCHSPPGGPHPYQTGGSFFRCAKQEARTGGAIAYVVKNSDLKDVDIQQPEIFKDSHRKIDGITPLERLRLRRFTGKKTDLLVPELRTYGTKNIGFYNQVKDWAFISQKSELEKINPEEDFRHFDLKGGSYQDTRPAGMLWSSFFDKKITGEKESLDEPEEETDNQDIYDAAETQIAQHSVDWTHFSVHHDVYEGDNLDYTAYCDLSIPVKLFTVKLTDNFTDKENYQHYRQVVDTIKNSIDIYTINDINLNVYNQNYVFSISFYDESGLDRGDNQLTRLEHFLDYIDDVDKKFESHHKPNVYSSLIEKGYLKSISDTIEFKNFEIEEIDGEVIITSKPEKITYLKEFPVVDTKSLGTGIGFPTGDRPVYEDGRDKIFLNQLRNKLISTPSFKLLKILPTFFKTKDVKLYLNKGLSSVDTTDEKISIPFNGKLEVFNVSKVTGWVYFSIEIWTNLDLTQNTKIIQSLKHLDNNWDFYIAKLAKFLDALIKVETRGFGWARKEPPNFGFVKKKDFPIKPSIMKPSEKQLTFKDFV